MEKCNICSKRNGVCRIYCGEHEIIHKFCKGCVLANFMLIVAINELGIKRTISAFYKNRCGYRVQFDKSSSKNTPVVLYHPKTARLEILRDLEFEKWFRDVMQKSKEVVAAKVEEIKRKRISSPV